MSRKYTAQEMRDIADSDDFIAYGYDDPKNYSDPDCAEIEVTHMVREMLRQAADDMERKKRWEYAVMYTALSGCRCISPGRADCIAATKNILSLYNKECEDANIVRRSVGEWEEVK